MRGRAGPALGSAGHSLPGLRSTQLEVEWQLHCKWQLQWGNGNAIGLHTRIPSNQILVRMGLLIDQFPSKIGLRTES